MQGTRRDPHLALMKQQLVRCTGAGWGALPWLARRSGALGRAMVAATCVMQPVPERDVTGELTLFVGELGVLLVGLGLRLDRAVSHILNRQGRGHHQHLGQGAAGTSLQNHAAHTGVERQPSLFIRKSKKL